MALPQDGDQWLIRAIAACSGFSPGAASRQRAQTFEGGTRGETRRLWVHFSFVRMGICHQVGAASQEQGHGEGGKGTRGRHRCVMQDRRTDKLLRDPQRSGWECLVLQKQSPVSLTCSRSSLCPNHQERSEFILLFSWHLRDLRRILPLPVSCHLCG